MGKVISIPVLYFSVSLVSQSAYYTCNKCIRQLFNFTKMSISRTSHKQARFKSVLRRWLTQIISFVAANLIEPVWCIFNEWQKLFILHFISFIKDVIYNDTKSNTDLKSVYNTSQYLTQFFTLLYSILLFYYNIIITFDWSLISSVNTIEWKSTSCILIK